MARQSLQRLAPAPTIFNQSFSVILDYARQRTELTAELTYDQCQRKCAEFTYPSWDACNAAADPQSRSHDLATLSTVAGSWSNLEDCSQSRGQFLQI
jgi:hypothetical protein